MSRLRRLRALGIAYLLGFVSGLLLLLGAGAPVGRALVATGTRAMHAGGMRPLVTEDDVRLAVEDAATEVAIAKLQPARIVPKTRTR